MTFASLFRKRKLSTFLFLLLATHIFPQETSDANYAASVIARVLRESPEGVILGNSVESTELSFRQQQKTWIPSVRLDLSADSKLVQGDYRYVRNGGIISSPQIITAPTASIGISQKLPGNGELSVGAGYGISCLPSQNAYIQQPYLQLGLSQSLSRGAFFITKDPSSEKLKNQMEVFRLEGREAMFELAVRFVSAVQDYNLAVLEEEYRSVVLVKAEAEYREQSHRHQSGQRNDMELFNSHMSHTQAVQSRQQSSQKVMEAEAVLARYKIDGMEGKCDLFRDEINALLSVPPEGKPQTTMQEREILGEIRNEELSLRIDRSRLAPTFYMQATMTPDQNKINEYSDFSRSLRDIVNSPNAWTVNATVGVSVSLDWAAQGKALKDVSDMKVQNLMLQLDVLRDEQDRMRNLYREWSETFPAYCAETEEEYRKDIRTLMESHQITEAEYWAAEANYYETRLNYYRSVWSMIQGKLYVLRLSSDWEEFIRKILEAMT